jgi:hypothetical protein
VQYISQRSDVSFLIFVELTVACAQMNVTVFGPFSFPHVLNVLNLSAT